MPNATQQHLLLTALELASRALPVLRGSDLSALLGAVAQGIGADTASLARIDLAGRDETAILWPAARAASAPGAFDAYAGTAGTHPVRGPLLKSVRENRPWTLPIRLSEVATQIAWRGTPLRTDVLTSVTDQLCLPLSYDGSILTAISLGRSGGTFSSRECELLRLVGPHLRAAVARTRGTDTLALRLVPKVAWTTACFAPARRRVCRGHRAACRQLAACGRPTGQRRTCATGPAAGPAVTARERQVLDLVAEGLTDAAIGRRLGLATATVSKHLQRVYARHGLGNRALATRWWLERRDGS